MCRKYLENFPMITAKYEQYYFVTFQRFKRLYGSIIFLRRYRMKKKTNVLAGTVAIISALGLFGCSAAAVGVVIADQNKNSGLGFILLGIALVSFLVLVASPSLSSFGSRKSSPVATKDTPETKTYHRGYYDGTQGLDPSVDQKDSRYAIYKEGYIDGEKGKARRLAYAN